MAGTLLAPRLAASGRLVTYPRQRVGELVYNGDFEYAPAFTASTNTQARWIDGTASGSTTNNSFGYNLYYATGTFSARFDTAEKYSGLYSMKLSSNQEIAVSNSSMQAGYYRFIFPITPSTSYTLSGMMKTTTAGSGTAQLGVRQYSSNGTNLSTTYAASVSGTGGWLSRSQVLTTQATAAYAAVIYYVNALGTTVDAWFDDISLAPNNSSLARTNLL